MTPQLLWERRPCAHRPDLCEQSVTRLGRSTLLLRADDRRVLALVPQVEPTSFISKLFRFFSLPAVFETALNGIESRGKS